MPEPKIGVAIPAEFKSEDQGNCRSVPLLKWDISEEARNRIEQLEDNSRRAELQLGKLMLA